MSRTKKTAPAPQQDLAHRVGALAGAALAGGALAEKVGPAVGAARERVAPHVGHAREWAAPHVGTAAVKVAPAVVAAKEARERVAPHVEHARERIAEEVVPALESVRERLVEEVVPKLAAATTAAAGAAAVAGSEFAGEARTRSSDALAVLKGEAVVTKPRKRGRGRRVLRVLLVLGTVAAGVAVVQRRRSAEDPWASPGATWTTPKAPAAQTTQDTEGGATVVDVAAGRHASAEEDDAATGAAGSTATGVEDSADGTDGT
ncbi:hypothetical protein, partial [Kineococcus glutinatus]|uniref:hypothetical protein n=1 Tax=Kineococcus glutinatus TaxID=1070872 RepID=UPI0031F08320